LDEAVDDINPINSHCIFKTIVKRAYTFWSIFSFSLVKSSKMQRSNVNGLFVLLAVIAVFSSCNKLKKVEKSKVTGWNYNDKKMGSYNVSKEKDQRTGPGLVFVQGGTFIMGATDEDVLGNWDNIPRRKTVTSFLIDRTEVANVHYREYLYWLENVFPDSSNGKLNSIRLGALPDTLVWRSELSANEPYVDYYFRHPSFNYYPVVGVTWRQANDFCLWRTNRVNELIMVQKGFFDKEQIQEIKQDAQEQFSTKSYLLGIGKQFTPDKVSKFKKNGFLDSKGETRLFVKIEDGILLPNYRLPTEAEWEFAAYGLIAQNPRIKTKEGKRGEELLMDRQVYSWNTNVNGLRDSRSGTWQGKYMANFKRGTGDYMGVQGGLNDNAAYTGPVEAFLPNGLGLYNMSGNVNEWVADLYRPVMELDELNPYRGNVFKELFNKDGKYVQDSLGIGDPKYVTVKDSAVQNRRNYQTGDARNYNDGDPKSRASYSYGKNTLISDKSRVYKGGSWDDISYWLSPGTRRHLEEDQSSSTIGFRCAMDWLGAQEGNGFKTGQHFGKRRQNSRKSN
jgi:sulfatase modifying factor 1